MNDKLVRYLDSGSINVSGFLLTNFSKMGISANALVVLLELLYFRSRGDFFPNPEKIANVTGISNNDIYDILHQLIAKKIIMIKTNSETGKDEYSFHLLMQKISGLVDTEDQIENHQVNLTSVDEKNEKTERKKTFQLISKEFGRMLSPFELEMINSWFDKDKYKPELINLALKEAVLNQVYNLKYMDRILLNWKKANIRSAAQVEQQNKNYHGNNKNGFKKDNQPKIPLFKIKKK